MLKCLDEYAGLGLARFKENQDYPFQNFTIVFKDTKGTYLEKYAQKIELYFPILKLIIEISENGYEYSYIFLIVQFINSTTSGYKIYKK